MKVREMNSHQRAVYELMDKYTTTMIGGCENDLMDYSEDEEEYQEAKAYLEQGHEALKKDIYDAVMSQCKAGSNSEHARFAGKEFLLERIERRLVKWGY